MVIFLIVLFLVFIFAAVISKGVDGQIKKQQESRDILSEQINRIPGFSTSKQVLDYWGRWVIGVDKESRKIAYIDNASGLSFIPFEEIISVEQQIDDTTIYQKSIGRTVGGALVGGALSGGAGAIVGGLSGSSTKKREVDKIEIKILRNNFDSPKTSISCFEKNLAILSKSNNPKNTAEYIYNECLKKADLIKDIINIVIDQNNKQ